jgi:hypothetical protein
MRAAFTGGTSKIHPPGCQAGNSDIINGWIRAQSSRQQAPFVKQPVHRAKKSGKYNEQYEISARHGRNA